ncbi:MAG: hypothetical protein QOF14_3204 [Hyphomicrobiales bacterium]|nr:hypothetical protein [Hyphomicrobiales bacterium]
MGKVADSERIKLRAIFYNNLSVGTMIGGVVAPYITFVANETLPSKQTQVLTLLAAISLLITATGLRRFADEILSRLQD